MNATRMFCPVSPEQAFVTIDSRLLSAAKHDCEQAPAWKSEAWQLGIGVVYTDWQEEVRPEARGVKSIREAARAERRAREVTRSV